MDKRQKVLIKPKSSSATATAPEPVPNEIVSVSQKGKKGKSMSAATTPMVAVDYANRVYALSSSKKNSVKYISNNIVQLQLYVADIKAIEGKISDDMKLLLADIDDKHGQPKAWNDTTESTSQPPETPPPAPQPKKDPFKALIKRPTAEFKEPVEQQEDGVSRKDLIINSGVKRQSKQMLQVYANEWPATSPYACWIDCHVFDTTPVGIPHSLINGIFYCYGNFCSYNCAKRYLCPNSEDDDDMAMMQTPHDIFIRDDKAEKLQLLELLCHIETGTPLSEPIKKAPKRMVLRIFGGDKSIEEYRASFSKNTTFHIFKSPLLPISYQMEECTNKADIKKKPRCVSLDAVKIERAYDALLQEKEKNKTILQKLLKQ